MVRYSLSISMRMRNTLQGRHEVNMAKKAVLVRDISDITQSSPTATVSGVLTTLSPMKKASKSSFFNGSITDDKMSMRIYGFDTNVRKRLADFEQAPLVFGNCEVKRSRIQPHELEVFVPSHTKVHNNDKSYSIDKDAIPMIQRRF